MQFLFPGFLWALLCLAIPIIIHLFYFRRFKKVYFTNVRFLKEIKEETSNRNKLKNLLILLSRLLAMAALIFAFAQPYISDQNAIKQGANAISIFVDNSYSMTAKKEDIPLLDLAKDKAKSIITAYSEDDKFQIFTHDFEGRHQRWISREDALTYLEEITSTPSVQSLDKVFNKQQQLFNATTGNKISYVISDFQRSITQLKSLIDTTAEYNLLPIATAQDRNIGIDSVWFDGPIPVVNQSNNLVIRVKNYSKADIEAVKLSFKKDGQDKPIGVIDIPAQSSITDTVVVNIQKSGLQQAVVSLTDYPVQFDDNYFISFKVADTIKALSINESGPNRYLDALFRGLKNFNLSNQNITQLQYQRFSENDLIIVNELRTISSGLAGELVNYVRNGGNILVFPSKSTDINSYNILFSLIGAQRLSKGVSSKKEVGSLNRDEYIFKDVYLNNRNSNLKLPVTNFAYEYANSTARAEEKLMAYRDGTAFMSKYRYEDGQVYICASPLDVTSSDLVLNAEVFVPMLFKMAIAKVKQRSISYTISNNVTVQTDFKPKAGDQVYRIKGDQEFIPTQIPQGKKLNLTVNNNIRKAGYYDLLLAKDTVDQFAFNYNRMESDLSIYNESDLTSLNPTNPKIKVITSSKQADIASTVTEKDRGIALWKWFLVATLIFLLIESLLIRYFK
jgi:hypothetical protein